jgi:hypothetical protein
VCGVDSSAPICGSVVGCCEHVEVPKMQETSSLGEDLLASLEGLCFMESFFWLVLEERTNGTCC